MKKKEAKYPIPIREWSEDDRPREKLLKYGEHTPFNVHPPLAGLPRLPREIHDSDRAAYFTGACPACPVKFRRTI